MKTSVRLEQAVNFYNHVFLSRWMTISKGVRGAVLLCLFLVVGLPLAVVVAQSGGYNISWWTVDGGGLTGSSGGSYQVNGTIGQPDAGQHSGGSYTLFGGFWNRADPTATPTPTSTPTAGQGGDPDGLPATGFAYGRLTRLADQPAEKAYQSMNDLRLEIPALDLSMQIVGVPFVDGNWDVSWLGTDAGWLENSAYPTWDGNSVITGHVWNADNTPGPFVNLGTLQWGDRVIIHGWQKDYVYEVRSVDQVQPDELDSVLQHRETSWLTLLTCHSWDAESGSYRYRIAVQAVLVEVK